MGLPLTAQLHIVDEEGNEVAVGESGTVYFEGGGEFEYFNDEEKTKDSRLFSMNPIGMPDNAL